MRCQLSVSREHARQKKLLRKRQKRQEKLRARQQEVLAVPWHGVVASMPKVSDTIVEFARPLIDELPDDCSGQRVEMVLNLASIVWNMMLIKDGDVAETVREVMSSSGDIFPEDSAHFVEFLAQRKQQFFSHDLRIIAGVRAYRDGGEIRVMAAGAL